MTNKGYLFGGWDIHAKLSEDIMLFRGVSKEYFLEINFTTLYNAEGFWICWANFWLLINNFKDLFGRILSFAYWWSMSKLWTATNGCKKENIDADKCILGVFTILPNEEASHIENKCGICIPRKACISKEYSTQMTSQNTVSICRRE